MNEIMGQMNNYSYNIRMVVEMNDTLNESSFD